VLAKASAVSRVVVLAGGAAAVLAPIAAAAATGQAPAFRFSLGETFTFLFLMIGPLKIIGPFASMTRGQDVAFKRQLAFQGTSIAAIAAFAAATVGATILHKWGISIGALLLTAGVLLFLAALRMVMEQYAPHEPRAEAPAPAAKPAALAFSPLAFPTVITPYGIAMLVVLVTLRSGTMVQFFTVVAGVLVLDLLAMLFADSILKPALVASALGILGAVMGVLQVALGVQAIVAGLRALGIVGTPAG
jgi:multiple antibiotic resistance protein